VIGSPCAGRDLVSLVQRIGVLRWIRLLHKRLLAGGPFGSGQPLKRKRQRTETIHPRGRVIEKPIQALADVIAFADVDPPLRTIDCLQTRGVRRLVDTSVRERVAAITGHHVPPMALKQMMSQEGANESGVPVR
jgi:hypothetical protein